MGAVRFIIPPLTQLVTGLTVACSSGAVECGNFSGGQSRNNSHRANIFRFRSQGRKGPVPVAQVIPSTRSTNMNSVDGSPDGTLVPAPAENEE